MTSSSTLGIGVSIVSQLARRSHLHQPQRPAAGSLERDGGSL